jgi:hypothetical protein
VTFWQRFGPNASKLVKILCSAEKLELPITKDTMPSNRVLISEVGPRDGLQSVKQTMPTAHKLKWIDALVASGLQEIEVASFVPAHLPPPWFSMRVNTLT